MNVSASQGVDAALQALQGSSSIENKRAQLQIMMLKKALDNQQQQADELTQQMQGKGQIIDLRV